MTKTTKRGRGRPRLMPKSPEQLREEARAGIKRSLERRLGRSQLEVEEFCEDVNSLTHRNKFTKEERDELKEKVQLIYEEYVTQKWEKEAEHMAQYTDTLRALTLEDGERSQTQMQTWEDWCSNHGLRLNGKRKPGPPKAKKKTVFDIPAGELGTEDKPSEPFDEKAFENQWMDLQIAKQKEEERFLKGRRLRKIADPPPRRAEPKNFWI